MGWIGMKSELLHTLRTFGCDCDEEGRPKVDGQIVSFMGAEEEFVVGDNAVVYIDGKPRNICNLLEATSYGLKVKVI